MSITNTIVAEVCLKSISNDTADLLKLESSNDQSISHHQLLSQALTIYIKSDHQKVLPNSYHPLHDITYFHGLSTEMLQKLLQSSQDNDGDVDGGSLNQMNLTKAQILIAIHIDKVYISESISQMSSIISLNDIWKSLEELKLTKDVKNNQLVPKDSLTSDFHFIFYQNVDSCQFTSGLYTANSYAVIDEFSNITLNSTNPTLNEPMHQLSKLFNNEEELEYLNESVKCHALPNSKFDLLWNELKLDPIFKGQVLNQISNSINIQSTQSVKDPDINNLYIFHGPPGSGKSTFCKAISQRLSILHQFNNSTNSLILEISCEKIFSKWYGESSLNLIKLFQILIKIIEHYPNSLIILIIDEIETLANSRSQILTKNETSDGIRIVNTLLTQLDFLKKYSNFVILATSNLIDSIDEAFLDRSDGCFFIDKPNIESIYQILTASINSKRDEGILNCDADDDEQMIQQIIYKLSLICNETLGVSGRTIKKLPQIAISRLTQFNKVKKISEKIHISHLLDSLTRIILEKIQQTNE